MRILEGQSPKWYMGIAWGNYNSLTWIVYPIPFNFTARFARDLWYLLRAPKWMRDSDRKLYDIAYNRGLEIGMRRGHDEGYRDRQLELERDIIKLKASLHRA